MLEHIPELGPHAYAEGGMAGIAARAGVRTDEMRQRFAADRNARQSRMNGGHAGRSDSVYASNQRLGLVYRP